MCIRDRNKWTWGEDQDLTFRLIKEKFLESVILRHPDFKKPFFLNCDASDLSLGTTLYQEDEEGQHLVISFASRTLNQCEKNYSVTEKELLSVVFACSKFRTYILGYQVTVRTDHKSISFLRRCKLSHGLSLIHIYWSETTQNLIRDNIFNGRYRAQLGSSMTAYFLGKVCMAKHLEPAIPEECLVNKISYHYDEDIIRARRGSQIKTIQAMTELLEGYENEEYYRQSRKRNERPEARPPT